jgi:hypothetical protein
VKIASEMAEWEQAFRLVAENYRARGYESAESPALRFTPHHALPDTTTFVAKHEGTVLATLSLVSDNCLLGLPMECVYPEEIEALRGEGRNLVEVTSLADRDLSLREFVPVFNHLLKVMVQWGISQGADTWVITVNPRHRTFYRKALGFLPIGPWRPHPSVQNNPAEAYKLDVPQLARNAPKMHDFFFGDSLLSEVLTSHPMPPFLVRMFSRCSTAVDCQTIEEVLRFSERFGSPRKW